VADDEQFDVAVIGAGIHGAGVAQAAAAAGYRVLILEQSAVAAGTSSRSSKLIHGGLRYLEYGDLRLVYECLRERKRLLKIAPDLVSLIPQFIPVYRATRRRPLRLRLGLSLYALLGGLSSQCRFQRVPPGAWGDLDGLNGDGLEAVFQYWDARTDDAALTRAVVASAVSLGAELRLPAEFTGARWEASRWSLAYVHRDQARRCRATVLINAAGPWVDRVLARIEPAPDRVAVELVQGAHVMVGGHIDRGVYYVEAPRDRRAVFIMPWQGRVLVGTTETPYHGDPGGVRPRAEEVDYLMETLAHYFPRYRGAAVLESFAGVRVLPSGHGTLTRRSRETLLYSHRGSGGHLLTIYGGKLTAYRLTAERVVHRVAPLLPRRSAKGDTRTLVLGG
jgi:glycerol-3-phosphate dehydrogenase